MQLSHHLPTKAGSGILRNTANNGKSKRSVSVVGTHNYRSPSPPTAARLSAVTTPVFDNRHRRKTIISSSSSPQSSSSTSSSSPSTPLSANFVTSPLSSPDDGDGGAFGSSRNKYGSHKLSPSSVKKARGETMRTTNIQVCVRMRPILPSDAAAAAASSGSREGLPPTPEQKMKNTSSSRKNTMYKDSSRLSSISRNSSSDGTVPTSNNVAVIDTEPAWDVQGNTVWQAEHTNPESNRRNTYTFDHTFGPSNDNRDLYNSTVKDTVISTMEGYHASVFAYGQTATGKTFTMTGKRGGGGSGGGLKNGEGIVQLAIRGLF
jgi:Kinesin-like protein